MVRINKNKKSCNPAPEIVFKAYRSKFGKVTNEDAAEYDDMNREDAEEQSEGEECSDSNSGDASE